MSKEIEVSPAGKALGLDKKIAADIALIERVLGRVLSGILERRKVMENIDVLMKNIRVGEIKPKPAIFSKVEFLNDYIPRSKADSFLFNIIEEKEEALEKFVLRIMGIRIYEIGGEDWMRELMCRVCEKLPRPGPAATILDKAWDGIGHWLS